MSKLPQIALLSLVSLGLSAQANAAKVIDLSGKSASILQDLLPSHASNSLQMDRAAKTDVLRVLSQSTANQITHTAYQQYHKGIPVYGHQVVTHEASDVNRLALTPSKSAMSMNGQLIQEIDKPATASISEQAALDFAKARYGRFRSKETQYSKEKAQLVYFIDEKNAAHLAYVVSFFANSQGKPAQPTYIIDANNKQVLKQFNALKTNHSPVQAMGEGGNEKTGEYTYGKDFDYLDIEFENGVCYLENRVVKTVDMQHKQSNQVNKPYQFVCSAPSYDHSGDEYMGSYSVQDDAHYFGEVISKMYQEWYDTKPLDFQLVMRVHFGRHYENAFWDGMTMNFGDGGQVFYPLVSLDVAAHEVSHGFTEQHANLIYEGQSGGINESFSDMAGKTAEYYMHGSNTWGIGESITKDGFGATCQDGSKGALRCMDDPSLDEISIGDARDYPKLEAKAKAEAIAYIEQIIKDYQLPVKAEWLENPPQNLTQEQQDLLQQLREALNSDMQGYIVHTASGVFNRAFYALATTADWDIQKAFHVFLYANQHHYWTPGTQFNDGAYAVIQAARALSYDTQAVQHAFEKVGIICHDDRCETMKV